MKKIILFIVIMLMLNPLSGQELSRSDEYVIKTPFVESDGRTVSVVYDNDVFLAGKSRGGNAQNTVYTLQRIDQDLNVKWTARKQFSEEEQLLEMKVLNDKLVLIWVTHDLKKKTKSLDAELYSIGDGFPINQKQLLSGQVGDWKEMVNKGQSVIGLRNTINSGNRKDLVTPLEYQYQVRQSPDGSKILAFSYDNSKDDLYIDLKVFDADLKEISKARIPINRGFINQDILINNSGEIFILNAKENGLIAVVKYNIQEKKSNYLEVEVSNTDRASFTGALMDDDHFYVADLNLRNGHLVGLSYTEFDFKEDKVGKIIFYPLTREFKTEIKNQREFLKVEEDDEHWRYYQITRFKIFDDGSKMIEIEQRNYDSRGFLFDPQLGNHPSQWTGERIGELRVGDAFFFMFDAEGELKWRQSVYKHQTGNAHEGLNIMSYHSYYDASNDLNMVYELYGKAHHEVHFKKFSYSDGKPVINKVLDNPDKLNLLMPFTTWFQDRVILVGKKGFSGRNSKILLYKY